MFAWGVGLRGRGREGEWLLAMARIGSMRVREEKRMVGIGLCERGKERLGEDGIMWVEWKGEDAIVWVLMKMRGWKGDWKGKCYSWI